MSYSRVMCLVRGDDTDAEVVETAVGLSTGNHRSIRFVHVIVVGHRQSLDAMNSTRYARAEGILRDAEHVSGLRNEARGAILQARSIGPVLVREALDFGAEAIVMSAKIVSTFSSKSLDADSDYLLANAPCAVILVREAVEDFEPGQENGNANLEAAVLPRR